MRIYIVGPMTGKQDYNKPVFLGVQAEWRRQGHDVLTPFDGTHIVWIRHYNREFRDGDSCEYGSPQMLECWVEDVKILMWSDAIALLPEWETSRGSRLEVQTALLFGKRIFNAMTFEELKLKVKVEFSDAT